jgi:iron only hydrogenase large subunit-like protein
MDEFDELYKMAVDEAVQKKISKDLKNPQAHADYDKYQLDCLLNPEKSVAGKTIAECLCVGEKRGKQEAPCFFEMLRRGGDGRVFIDPEKKSDCLGCLGGENIDLLMKQPDVLSVFEMLMHPETPVYALIAPAYISQFSEDVTPGMLRSAFKHLGFAGMIEVALFADILTLKEALEYDRSIKSEKDFVLASSCCPMWIAMIRSTYKDLVPHIPPSVSPMVACGRSIKLLHPNAKTVFIGPCIAKKAEAREKDVADAIDHVLTFQEVREIFRMTGVRPEEEEEDLRSHSSLSGRIYARAGGVTMAVRSTVERLHPNREIPFKAQRADGVAACKALLEKIKSGDIDSNFIEGMGCAGGCVGGPKALIPRDEGAQHVNHYALSASCHTPVDNPYVMDLLHRLGIDTIEALLEDTKIFTRHFD